MMKQLLVFLGLLLCAQFAAAEQVQVAVAANFAPVMKDLQKDFEATTSHTILASYGSSGTFFAQITHGAPFEVFLSADAERPEKLEAQQLTVEGSRFTYAIGQLVLWSPKAGVVDNKGAVLATDSFTKLAIADPKTAPYGAAARQALENLNLWTAVQSKLVQGIDIGQAYQFVATGNAELGLVAFSQIHKAGKPTGSWWLVNPSLYQPLHQQAVLLAKGKDNAAARALLAYLKSDAVRKRIQSYGYKAE